VKHALVVHGLVKAFGNHVAVDDISFEVPRGVVYGILGPNGAGKSTMLRMINDIFAPDAGEIVVLDGMKPGSEAAQKIGYLPEERGLYPKMKVVEMIEFIGELRGLPARNRSGAPQVARPARTAAVGEEPDPGPLEGHAAEGAVRDRADPRAGAPDPRRAMERPRPDQRRGAARGGRRDPRGRAHRAVLDAHHGAGREDVRRGVHHRARQEGARRQAARHQARLRRGGPRRAQVHRRRRARSAEPILADRTLVAEKRAPRAGDLADCEVKLAEGTDPAKLLSVLVAAGVKVRRFEVVVPTLHQIFVDRVGETAAVADRRPEEAA
jgi:ABC-2 type transport system ATP-binding protein